MYNNFNFGVGELIAAFIIGIISLIVFILYLLSLQKALKHCSAESRTTSPGSVWLMLIPIFNLIWQFILVIKISESLHNEFTKRNIPEDPHPGKTIGLTYCILVICSIIPFLGFLASIAALVCWIIYWVKISGFSNKLLQPVAA